MAWTPSGILQEAEKVSHVLHSVTGTEASASPSGEMRTSKQPSM
ncbi:MAG: hypothetical protein ACLSHX_15235 [Suilimivivens sp.]